MPIPADSQRSPSSSSANVATVSPLAISGSQRSQSAGVPAFRMALAASATLER